MCVVMQEASDALSKLQTVTLFRPIRLLSLFSQKNIDRGNAVGCFFGRYLTKRTIKVLSTTQQVVEHFKRFFIPAFSIFLRKHFQKEFVFSQY